MDLALLPQFGGELLEPWALHEVRLISWIRLHDIAESDEKARVDFLTLSLKPNSSPLCWFIDQPPDLRQNFTQALQLLKNKYGNDLRKEMHRISAMNCLQVRNFRDNEHKTEMVFELINELEHLLTCASVDQDTQRREYLLRCFRSFSGAMKMMNRTTSYDSAVLAALNWEASVILKAEEAMLRTVMKRQLGQKSQNAHARTKRKSDPTDPGNHLINHPPTDRANDSIPQGFEPNPDTYHNARLPPPQLLQPKSSHEPSSNHKAFQSSTGVAANYLNPSTRDDIDPSQVMESLVDPHLLARQSPRRLQKFYQNGSYPNLAAMNQESQEIMVNHMLSSTQPQQARIKPLIYDAQRNPYPPPERLPENQPQSQIKPLVYDALKNPYPPPEQLAENKPQIQNSRLQPSASFSDLPHPLDRLGPNFPIPSSHSLERSKRLPYGSKNTFNPAQTTSVPFPSSQASTKPFPGPPDARTQQGTPMLPGSSSQRGSIYLDSDSNLHHDMGTPHHQFIPLSRSENEENGGKLKKRRSKLVKLRRNGSASTNNSGSSAGSFRQVKSLIGSLNKIAGRSSQSGDESDSTQDQGPNTPSSFEPGAGGSGSGVDSEGNERLRPMQAQFFRLFRKHNHPEHLRRQKRVMFMTKPMPETQNSIKGKNRAVDIQLTPASSR